MLSQALVATAVGFPPSMFRRMLQSNGATTVLDFTPVAGGPPTVTINRLNQVPLLSSLKLLVSAFLSFSRLGHRACQKLYRLPSTLRNLHSGQKIGADGVEKQL